MFLFLETSLEDALGDPATMHRAMGALEHCRVVLEKTVSQAMDKLICIRYIQVDGDISCVIDCINIEQVSGCDTAYCPSPKSHTWGFFRISGFNADAFFSGYAIANTVGV